MPNLGGAEILVILLVALLVLGPDKLPGAARSLGRGLSHLRRLSGGFEQEIRNAMSDADGSAADRRVSGAPTNGNANGNGVHPGLGPGPKLGAGAVALDPPTPPNGSTGDARTAPVPTRPVVEGPDESFS